MNTRQGAKKSTKIRHEHRCKCGNVVVIMDEPDKRPEDFKCDKCKHKGKWGEKYDFPKPNMSGNELKQEEIPAPVFLHGKPHFIINNQYVGENEGMVLILERRIAKDKALLQIYKDKINKESGAKDK